MGSTGRIHLGDDEMEAMLRGGAKWAVERGWGRAEDLERIDERGCMTGAEPEHVSARARSRQRNETGTLGSGNHYLEVQRVADIFTPDVAAAFGLAVDDVVVSIHCGSRGLGHQIGTDYLRAMGQAAKAHGLRLPDKELACAPLLSDLGQRYLGAMRAGINCALANRQILTHLTRQVFARRAARSRPRPPVRRIPQHVQGRGARRGRSAAPAVRASQRRDTRVRTRSPGAHRVIAGHRTAGPHRRHHGHRVPYPRRDDGRDGAVVRLRMPRCGAADEPASGDPHLAWGAGLACKVARLEPLVCVKG